MAQTPPLPGSVGPVASLGPAVLSPQVVPVRPLEALGEASPADATTGRAGRSGPRGERTVTVAVRLTPAEHARWVAAAAAGGRSQLGRWVRESITARLDGRRAPAPVSAGALEELAQLRAELSKVGSNEPGRSGVERADEGRAGAGRPADGPAGDRSDPNRAGSGPGSAERGRPVIAKITRGTRVGDIAAYLHGPGKANEHRYRDGSEIIWGGQVIGGNLGREGDHTGVRWAQDLRAAQAMRPEIKYAIWQTSLRTAPGDRRLSDAEWADAGQTFAEQMGFDQHPWVMVRHGEDHVHIVTSRVSETGVVWHARQDYRQAQTAARQLEHDYGLTEAPRQRAMVRARTPAAVERQEYRDRQVELTAKRAEELAHFTTVMERATAGLPPADQAPKAQAKRDRDSEAGLDAARHTPDIDRRRDRRDRGHER